MFNFITRVAETEVASNSVCTILVASTDVTCTLVNVCKYNEKYALYVVKCTLINVLNSIGKKQRYIVDEIIYVAVVFTNTDELGMLRAHLSISICS